MQVVVLAEYDRAWATRFEAERARILRALGEAAIEIHHIGSTAVEGLLAKPIVDVLVVATGLDAVEAGRAALEAEGLRWLGEHGIAGRRYLVRPDPSAPLGKVAHVHAFAKGHAEIARHLRFRDLLRVSPRLREAYASLKDSLRDRSREEYQRAKEPFIEAALET